MTLLEGPMEPGDPSFVRTAAIVAIASLPLAVGNLFAMLASVHYDFSGMNQPLVLLRAGASSAGLWRWAMVLDVVGYYLPIIPLILVLHSSFRRRAPSWIDLFALCLLAYCLIGAIGGAELATAVPTLMTQYAAHPAHRVALETTFTGFTDGIYRGMWNLLEELLAGIAWVGFGVVLRTTERRLGFATISLGIACLVDALGTALGMDAIGSVGLTVYLVLAPLWACWLGLRLLGLISSAEVAETNVPLPSVISHDPSSDRSTRRWVRPL